MSSGAKPPNTSLKASRSHDVLDRLLKRKEKVECQHYTENVQVVGIKAKRSFMALEVNLP